MIDILRRYEPAMAWLRALGSEELALPGLVAMELLQGCGNRTDAVDPGIKRAQGRLNGGVRVCPG